MPLHDYPTPLFVPPVPQTVQENSAFSYFQSIGDVHENFLQSQEPVVYSGDSNCEELEEDDFDAGIFYFHDASNFGEFIWPPEMLHNMEHSRGGSKSLRYCISRK